MKKYFKTIFQEYKYYDSEELETRCYLIDTRKIDENLPCNKFTEGFYWYIGSTGKYTTKEILIDYSEKTLDHLINIKNIRKKEFALDANPIFI